MPEFLGLAKKTEDVYRLFLFRRDLTVFQAAQHLGLSLDEIKVALDELIRLGLIVRTDSTGLSLRPVNPGLGLTKLIALAEEEVEARRRQITVARAAATALAVEAAQHGGDQGIARFDGIEAARERVEELALSVRVEWLSIDPVPQPSTPIQTSREVLVRAMLDRGVAVRSVCQQATGGVGDSVDHVRRITSPGGTARTALAPDTLMIVYDRSD